MEAQPIQPPPSPRDFLAAAHPPGEPNLPFGRMREGNAEARALLWVGSSVDRTGAAPRVASEPPSGPFTSERSAVPPATTESNDDGALLAALAEGDASALAKLYDLHASTMLGVARRFFRNRQDAEDLVHDVFLEAWQRAASFDAQRGSTRGWLLMRVRSRAIDRLRSLEVARRHAMAEARSADPAGPNVAPEWSGPDAARAEAALGALPAAQRRLVELSYFEGLTYPEMAALCEIPIGTVRSRLSAAMQKLRRALGAASE